MKKILLPFLLLIFSPLTHAAVASDAIDVGASVEQSCVFSVVYPNGSSAHVDYKPLVSTEDGVDYFSGHAWIEVKCNLGSENVRMFADEGLHKNASSTCASPQRRMSNGEGKFLDYNFRQNKDHDWYIWGCDTSNQTVLNFHDKNYVAFHGITVLLRNQDAAIGMYSDTVLITVLF